MYKFLRNISFTLTANISSLLISVCITFFLPKILGVEQYSYWQLSLFYTSYTGFLSIGLVDGFFLRISGKRYHELDHGEIKSNIIFISVIQIAFLILISFFCLFSSDINKVIIVIAAMISSLITSGRGYLVYLVQATNRFSVYTKFMLIEKISFVALILMANILYSNYQVIIFCDLLSKVFATLYISYKCKEVFLTKSVKFIELYPILYKDFICGIKLMLSNIAGMLIIGIVRMSIENQWSVEIFGKISLTMSISNILMVFIGAVSLVMFPLLRRTSVNKLAEMYSKMRTCLMLSLLGMLILYYPSKVILSSWLPQYAESLKYMAMLFPICVFESKMSMLVSTYMKTLRLEKKLLFVNVVTLCLSFIATGVTCFWLHSLDLAVLSIVILLAFRCILAESILSSLLGINVYKDIVLEVALTIIFVLSSWIIGGFTGVAVYIIAYGIYMLIQRARLVCLFQDIKQMLRGKRS